MRNGQTSHSTARTSTTYNPEALAPGKTLIEATKTLGLSLTSDEIEYVSSVPAAQQEAIRGALHSAVSRERRLPVTMAWAPGYDFELTVWEAAATADHAGAMTVLLRSPYAEHGFAD